MCQQSASNRKRYIPAYAKNPLKLGYQLLTNSNPAARSAVFMAATGVALAPIDRLFAHAEKDIYKTTKKPEQPILFVCGPPRSGTTLVLQYLVNSLNVGFINNLTSLFPRSPIYANKLFGKWAHYRQGSYNAFYGKSSGLSGPNDGLYLWDLWLGADRDRLTTELATDAEQGIHNFFGALQNLTGLPTVNKVNRLIGSAHLIAALLPTARFICVRRDPVLLAQSLLIARKQLTGSMHNAYGLHTDSKADIDPIRDVCTQVEFLNAQIDRQQALLGSSRLIVIDYKEFCHAPEQLINRIQSEWNLTIDSRPDSDPVDSFSVRDQVKLSASEYQQIQNHFDGLRPVTDEQR